MLEVVVLVVQMVLGGAEALETLFFLPCEEAGGGGGWGGGGGGGGGALSFRHWGCEVCWFGGLVIGKFLGEEGGIDRLG